MRSETKNPEQVYRSLPTFTFRVNIVFLSFSGVWGPGLGVGGKTRFRPVSDRFMGGFRGRRMVSSLAQRVRLHCALYQTKQKPAHLHLAFTAENRQQVEAFYRAALEAGGKDNGAPGLRPHYHANYYAAFRHCRRIARLNLGEFDGVLLQKAKSRHLLLQ